MKQSIFNMHPGLIIGFLVLVVIMLLLDLGIFNKKSHIVSSKEAMIWSAVWISLAMGFSGVIYYVFNQDIGGHEVAIDKITEFQAAYWVEKALSVDNLFVFILIFNFFKVPRELHHKVLFWGIVGALIFRAIFIFAGVGLINITYLPEMDLLGKVVKINPILTIFGVFLVYAGIKSWKEIGKENEEDDYSDKMGAKLVKRFYKVSDQYDGDKFFTIKDGVKYATPLLVVVTVIEFSDVLFAVDSIPAIFAISEDPFILYTSNIFAILGLRSLYFLLSNFIHMFDKLPYGLAIILSFIGLKMLISPWLHISSPVSLGIVAGVLLVSVVLSLMYTEDKR